jgi:BlaI family transcriptional regulator, penicillinase repressor
MEGAAYMKSQRLPDTEFEIMDYLWSCPPPVTTSMVMERIGRDKGWKIQTVVSLFARLTERGFLRVEKGLGRERAFFPAIPRDSYLRMETECFVSHYHKNSYSSLLNALQSERITEAELDDLAAWLKLQKGGGGD